MTGKSSAADKAFDIEKMASRASDATRLLKALANETRLMILCTLIDGEMSVGELNERFDLSQSALSQHLAVLRRDGLVGTRRAAQTIYYRLADGPAREVIRVLHEIYCSGTPCLPGGARPQSQKRREP